MFLAAAIASPINSYFLAEGRPSPAILAIAVELVVSFLLAGLLLGSLDEKGIGIAMSVGSLIAAAILLATTHPTVRAGTAGVAVAGAIAFVAAAVGQAIPIGDDFGGLVVSLAAVSLTWLVLSAIFEKREMVQVAGMIRSLMPGPG